MVAGSLIQKAKLKSFPNKINGLFFCKFRYVHVSFQMTLEKFRYVPVILGVVLFQVKFLRERVFGKLTSVAPAIK